MRRKIPFVAASLLALAVAFVTCGGGGKKNSGDATAGKTVFVAGQSNNRAMLWKDGTPQQLSSAPYSVASSVFVSGDDVYVAVWECDNENPFHHPHAYTSVLWKNGVRQVLSTSDDATAASVFVSGSDVYVAGDEDGYAVLWKNGTPQRLGWGWANSVFVYGSDVYVAGSLYDYPDNNGAVLWKNGTPRILSRGDHNRWQPDARSVFVSGSDVYVAGMENERAVLWKNGTLQRLNSNAAAAGFAEANSVYVSGSDVYVAGYEFDDPESDDYINKMRCVFWKNGIRQSLVNAAQGNSVFVKDTVK